MCVILCVCVFIVCVTHSGHITMNTFTCEQGRAGVLKPQCHSSKRICVCSAAEPHLHAFRLHLLHHHLDVNFARVCHVLLRLNVNLLNEPTCVDIVDGILTVINVVVLALLRSAVQQAAAAASSATHQAGRPVQLSAAAQ